MGVCYVFCQGLAWLRRADVGLVQRAISGDVRQVRTPYRRGGHLFKLGAQPLITAFEPVAGRGIIAGVQHFITGQGPPQ